MTLRLPTALATDSNAAAVTALTKYYGHPYLGDDAYVGAHFDSWSSTPGNIFEPKEPNTMNHEPMTQERREAFWRKYRWTPDLPAEQRKATEQVWTDEKIEEAEALSF